MGDGEVLLHAGGDFIFEPVWPNETLQVFQVTSLVLIVTPSSSQVSHCSFAHHASHGWEKSHEEVRQEAPFWTDREAEACEEDRW